MIFNDYSNNQGLQAVAVTSIPLIDNTTEQSIVDPHNDINVNQDDLPLSSAGNESICEPLEILAKGIDIDPWSKYTLDTARKVLSERAKFSIDQLAEAMDGGEDEPIKRPTLRKKLNILVDIGLLKSIPGRGRTPTYYFLPDYQSLDKLFIDSQIESHNDLEIASQYRDEIDALKKTLTIYEKKKSDLSQEIKEKESWLKKAEITIGEYETIIDSITRELYLLQEN
jgi:Fe2+ or Zn2+ uptake regulation protein